MSDLREIMERELGNGMVGIYLAKVLHGAGITHWGEAQITPEGVERTLLQLAEGTGGETGWLFVRKDPEGGASYGIKFEFNAQGD